MHGLKCAGAFPGWTRLCDEWLGCLGRAWTEDGSTPWEHPGMAVQTVAAAVARTRRFAHGGPEEPIAADAEGVLRFELQGVSYVVPTAEWCPEPGADLLDAASEKLDALLSAAKSVAKGEEHPVALLVLAPRLPAGTYAEARQATVEEWVDAFRGASLTHAMAYSFPRRPGTGEGPRASAERPGAFLLARSAVFP